MRCAACALDLALEDNYCRRCGAPVRVVGVETIPEASAVVRVGPSTPALLAGAARPLAAGAAVVAAGALARFAARSALRGLIGAPPARRAVREQRLPAREPRRGRGGQVVEVYWYRRMLADE